MGRPKSIKAGRQAPRGQARDVPRIERALLPQTARQEAQRDHADGEERESAGSFWHIRGGECGSGPGEGGEEESSFHMR